MRSFAQKTTMMRRLVLLGALLATHETLTKAQIAERFVRLQREARVARSTLTSPLA